MPSITSALTTFGYGRSSLLSNILILPTTGGFVIKYNSNGSVLWTARLGTSTVEEVYTDSSNNIYIVGTYTASIPIYNSDGSTYGSLPVPRASSDIFLIKYNPSGFIQWRTTIAGTTLDELPTTVVDSSGNIYVAASIANSSAFIYNSDDSQYGVLSTVTPTTAIVKYNSSGFVQWTARISAATTGVSVYPSDTAVDSSGNFYIIGYTQNADTTTSAFSTSDAEFATKVPTTTGVPVTYIVKYNSSGTVQWLTYILSSGVSAQAFGRGIAVDSSANVYVTGQGFGTVGVYSYNSGSPSLFGSLSFGGFIAKYNTSGNVQWIARVGGSQQVIGRGVTLDTTGALYVGGNAAFATTITAYDLSGNAFSPTLPSSGGGDNFVAKYTSGGLVQWLTKTATTANDTLLAISSDSSNNVYSLGPYSRPLTTFDVSGNAYMQLSYLRGTSSYMVKQNSAGLPLFVVGVASTTTADTQSVIADASNNVIICGRIA